MLCVMVFSLVSCGSDDDNNRDNENYMQYGDKRYELKAGILTNYGAYEEGDAGEFDLVLVTTDATNINGDFAPNDSIFSGIVFEMYSNSTSNLSTGKYSYDEDSEAPMALGYGECVIDYNYQTDAGQDYAVTAGQVDILKNGNPYEVRFKVTLDNGKTLKGHYKGSLEVENDLDIEGRILNNEYSIGKPRFFDKKITRNILY